MPKYECENCGEEFEYKRHERRWIPPDATPAILRNTGLNVVYRGDKDAEYVICPECGFLVDAEELVTT